MKGKGNELEAFNSLSARIGADPSLVQGAGGNTSIKQDGVMWIKASGTWLKDALTEEIMVPVALAPLLDALARNDPAAEKATDYVVAADNPSGLRPSIETTLHAIMHQRVVVHVHCVETIAVAVREDAEAVLNTLLADHDFVFVPYIRPGLPLARDIMTRLTPQTNVIVLGNHGLVIAADTLTEAETLLRTVSARLRQVARGAPAPRLDALSELIGDSNFRLPTSERAHAVACDPVSCDIAGGGSLYPDHVIFLGPGSVVAKHGESVNDVCQRMRDAGLSAPISILFPGLGVLIKKDANAGVSALANCLSDVTARIPEDAAVHYLSVEDNGQLLNWDAEQYRQALNANT